MELSTELLGIVGSVVFVVGGSASIFFVLLDQDGPAWRGWRQYIRALRAELNALALTTSPYEVITQELMAMGLLGFLAWYTGMILLWILCIGTPGLTLLLLKFQRYQRMEQLSLQLDGWLLMLANMLEATGSVGHAIRSSAELTQKPLAEELDILIKRVDVGTPLTQALDQMYHRVPVQGLRAVITSLRVGGRMGGELPKLLKENAASLREAERIDKFIKSKVSEGRAQVIVLALAPLGMVWGLKKIEPTFFDSLVEFIYGPHIIAGLIVLWVVSIWVALKIMDVDA